MVGEGVKPKEGDGEMMNYLLILFYLKTTENEKKSRSVDGWGRGKAQGGRGRDDGLLDQPELLHGRGPHMPCERSAVNKTV